MKLFVALLVLLCCLYGTKGQLFSISKALGSNMVLQMEPKRSQLWGTGSAHSQVILNFNDNQFITDVQTDGTWTLTLSPQPPGGPFNLLLSHTNNQGGIENLNISNVWFGDVWICGGNYQMTYPLSRVLNSSEEIVKAQEYSKIHLFQVSLDVSDAELNDLQNVQMPWTSVNAESASNFSGLCLLYAERLSDTLGSRPLGLIQVSYEAPIEAFVSSRVTQICNTPPTTGLTPESNNALWNAMIHPLTNTAVRGVMWTDGNSNVFYNYAKYECHIENLIKDWSSSFFDGDVAAENGIAFPFGIVQMGPANTMDDNELHALTRWSQTLNQGKLPNSKGPEAFLAPALDLADAQPRLDLYDFSDKSTAASRLSNMAKSLLYNISYPMSGPLVISADRSGQNEVTLTYDRDIRWTGGSIYTGFSYELAGSVWRDTDVISWTPRTITVAVDKDALQVTYGWKSLLCEYMQCPIYGDDEYNLPAAMGSWLLI